MALIAGAYSRFRDIPLPAGLEQALVHVISRRAEDARDVWSSPNAALVYCETGACREPAHVRDGTRAVTAVAGELLLSRTSGDGGDGDPRPSPSADTQRLHDTLHANDYGALTQATGPFAAFHYDAARHVLTLAGDKVGLRPLYYWIGDRMVVFASSLRIIEALDVVPKTMDVRSVMQLVPCGFIIGNGTPYAGVRLLGPGEVLHFEGCAHSVHRYWRLDTIATSSASVDDLADEAAAALRRAIARRLGRDGTAVAFLTGGMDTRLVVCELLRRGVRLHTLNGAFPGQQDQLYARLFAEAVGARHQEMPGLIADPSYPDQMARRWYDSPELAEMPPERPHAVWSGVGGSVALGAVSLDERLLATLRAGRLRDAVRLVMAYDSFEIPKRVLTGTTRRRIRNLLEESILAEYQRCEVDDPARLPWLFTILNEYRRAYASNVESVDVHRLESLVPLCDSDLLSVLASVPMDDLLRHKFYMRLVARSDARFLAVPWQVYPGHAACPVPALPGVPAQWDVDPAAENSAHRRRGLVRRVFRDTVSRDFASPLVGRVWAMSAVSLMALGLRNTHDALHLVRTVQHFFRACGGRMTWCMLGVLPMA